MRRTSARSENSDAVTTRPRSSTLLPVHVVAASQAVLLPPHQHRTGHGIEGPIVRSGTSRHRTLHRPPDPRATDAAVVRRTRVDDCADEPPDRAPGSRSRPQTRSIPLVPVGNRPVRGAVHVEFYRFTSTVAAMTGVMNRVVSKNTNELKTSTHGRDIQVLALSTVGDVYASLYKKGAYAPFSTPRRS